MKIKKILLGFLLIFSGLVFFSEHSKAISTYLWSECSSPKVVACRDIKLYWYSVDSVSCVASGGWSGAKSDSRVQQSQSVRPCSATTYTLTCSDAGGNSDSASVTIATCNPIWEGFGCPGGTGFLGTDLISRELINCEDALSCTNKTGINRITSCPTDRPICVDSGATAECIAEASAPNQLPTATIIAPSGDVTLEGGGSVWFSGTGNDPDGNISGYEWRSGSCTGALFQTSSSFYRTFSGHPGTYRRYLRVRDNDGDWSTNCPYRTITVTEPPCSCASSSNFCNGTTYNDSCGNPVCTGSKTCQSSYCNTAASPHIECIGGDVYEMYNQWISTGCSAGACTGSWSYNSCGINKIQDCGSNICYNGPGDSEYEYCQGNDIWVRYYESNRGCSGGACTPYIGYCGQTLKKECEEGFECREVSSNKAECVGAIREWTEI